MVYRKSSLHSPLYSAFSPLYRQLFLLVSFSLSDVGLSGPVVCDTSPLLLLPAAAALSLANGVTRASQRVTHSALTMSTARELDLNSNLKRERNTERKSLYKFFFALSKFPTSSAKSCTSFSLLTTSIIIIIRQPANCIAIRFILAE